MIDSHMDAVDRIRAKQDKLLTLARAAGLDTSLRIMADEPGSPTLAQLEPYIWPQWEYAIDHALSYLRGRRP